MATQGHGNHWECVTTSEELLNTYLPNLVEKGELEDKIEIDRYNPEDDDGSPSPNNLFTLAFEGNLSALALVVSLKELNKSALASAYPFVRDGEPLRLTIIEIMEWDYKVEAVIRAETGGGQRISFFDTKYHKNCDEYKVGDTYTFALSALGYDVEVLAEKDRSVGFLPNPEFPDDVEFQSPIRSIEKVSAFDTDFYKFQIQIYRDHEIDQDAYLPLYAKQSFFETEPAVGDPVRGMMWLQGYLVGE